MSLAEQIGNKGPRGSSWVAAIATTGVAALGGMLAGRVRGVIADLFPTFPGGGDVGVFVLATAIQKMASESNADWDAIFRQAAAGMAGKVGDSVWQYLRGMFGPGVATWKEGERYPAGSEVRYGSRIYRARSEVPKDGKEPPKDQRWEELRAQGLDYAQAAQALLNDRAAMGAIVNDFAQHMQAHLTALQDQYQMALPPDFAQRLTGSAAQCLETVVTQFTQ